MKISTLLEERKLLAVVYGGRFQPFHKGHYAVYQELCKTFGEGVVWIATSNKTNFDPGDGDVSPFNFEEKLEIMVQLFGISPEKVIKCKNPAFSPVEVLELYKAPTVCVMVAGEKDVERYSKSKMYKPYPTKKHGPVPFDQAMTHLQTTTSEPPQYYYVISDAQDGKQSGTLIRAAFQAAGDNEGKQAAAFKKFYGDDAANDDILDLLVSKIRMIKELPKKEEKKKEEKAKVAESSAKFPFVAANKFASKSQLLKLQTKLIDELADDYDIQLAADGVTVQLPGRKKFWVIPNTFDESLYFGELDMKGLTFDHLPSLISWLKSSYSKDSWAELREGKTCL